MIDRELPASADGNGLVSVLTSDAAAADGMAARLGQLNIPVRRTSNYPVVNVLINGRAKANPAVDEVAAEYPQGR